LTAFSFFFDLTNVPSWKPVHVIRFVDEQGDPVKVSHTWFDEQNEEGGLAEGEAGAMLGNVVNAATEYLFQ